MSLITPVPGGASFECCEVATIDPQGGVSGCRVWLTNGETRIYALSAAVVAALVVNGDADPILYGPIASDTFGTDIYVSPQNVAQLRQLAGLPTPRTLASMNGGPGQFIVEGLSADLVTDFNLVARCGAGAAAGPVVARYIPTVTAQAGVVANPAPLDSFAYSELTGVDPAPNLVNVIGSLNLSSVAGVTDAQLASVTLPIDMSNEFADSVALLAVGAQWQLSGIPVPLGVTRVNASTVMVTGTLPAGVNVYANLNLTYNRAGV